MLEQLLNTILLKVISIESRLSEFATKEDMQRMEHRMYSLYDSVTRRLIIHETEIASLRAAQGRVEERL